MLHSGFPIHLPFNYFFAVTVWVYSKEYGERCGIPCALTVHPIGIVNLQYHYIFRNQTCFNFYVVLMQTNLLTDYLKTS
jgi:hypothetical protein